MPSCWGSLIYIICFVNWLFMLPVRLQVDSRLSVWGESKIIHGFPTTQGAAPLIAPLLPLWCSSANCVWTYFPQFFFEFPRTWLNNWHTSSLAFCSVSTWMCYSKWKASGINSGSWSLFPNTDDWLGGRNMELDVACWLFNFVTQLTGIPVLSPPFTREH